MRVSISKTKSNEKLCNAPRRASHVHSSHAMRQIVSLETASCEITASHDQLFTLWARDNMLLQQEMEIQVIGRYTDSPGMWGGLVSEWQSAQLIDSWDAAGSSFYGYDSQSSTRLLTNASGVVTDNYAYRAFGTEWQSGNGFRNSYRYVGQYGYYRDSAAMQYVRARYLDVQAGRWVSQDPIGFHSGDWNLNKYLYNSITDDNMDIGLNTDLYRREITNRSSLQSNFSHGTPPKCTKYGKNYKPVWFTCDDTSPGKHAAVYCKSDRPSPSRDCRNMGDYCYSVGSRLGTPVFPYCSCICIHGNYGIVCRKIDDCGCGPKRNHKPTPDNWIDWQTDDCSIFKDGWRCVCSGPCKKKNGKDKCHCSKTKC